MTYAEKLKSPKWQKRRLEILERDKFTCKKCGDTETTLHVHHLSYHGEPWEAPNSELDTLCEHCHEAIEITKVSDGEQFDYNKVFIYKDVFGEDVPILFIASSIGDFRVQILGIRPRSFSFINGSSNELRRVLNKSIRNYDHAE